MDNLIIGSGFSSMCCHSLLSKNNVKIISPYGKDWDYLSDLNSRRNLSINKHLKIKSKSLGTVNYKLPKNIYLHDRFSGGGNSEIWGGFFDTTDFTSDQLIKLSMNGIKFVQLSRNFGVTSNIDGIVQLQCSNHEIIKSSNFIKPDINGFVIQISNLNDKKKLVKYVQIDSKHFETKEIEVERVIISCGVIQTIDLLLRSNIIKPDDILSLEENAYSLSISLGEKDQPKENGCVISYKFNRALSHYLGISSKLLKNFNPIPLLRIHQHFKNQKRKLFLKVHDLNNIYFKDLITQKDDENIKFGDSIHYCNLHINNIKINDIMNKYNNIQGVGMSFVSQNNPGPISNRIYSDCLTKI